MLLSVARLSPVEFCAQRVRVPGGLTELLECDSGAPVVAARSQRAASGTMLAMKPTNPSETVPHGEFEPSAATTTPAVELDARTPDQVESVSRPS